LAPELSGQRIEVRANFILAAAHGMQQGFGVVLRLWNLGRRFLKHLHELSESLGFGAAGRTQPIEDALAAAAVRDQAGAFELRQVCGNAALAHVQNVLQFGHGELFAGHQEQYPDAARVR
jgi:hypothetical protein